MGDAPKHRWPSKDFELAIRTVLLLSGLPDFEPKPLRLSEIQTRVEGLTGRTTHVNAVLRVLDRLARRGAVTKSVDRGHPVYSLKVDPTPEQARGWVANSTSGLIGSLTAFDIAFRNPETAPEPFAYGIATALPNELVDALEKESDQTRARIRAHFDAAAEALISRARSVASPRAPAGFVSKGETAMREMWEAFCSFGDGLGGAMLTQELADRYVPGWGGVTKDWRWRGAIPKAATSTRDLLGHWGSEAQIADPFLSRLEGPEGERIRTEWAALVATRVALTLVIR